MSRAEYDKAEEKGMVGLTPLQAYQQDIEQGRLLPDPAQEQAVRRVQLVYERLLAEPVAQPLLRRIRQLITGDRPAHKPVKGIYFYGGVGRGKTYIMDTFYESLPFPNKMRTHFHRFMQRVHAELGSLKRQKNPLEQVAGRIAAEARVICFDEFFVSDIGDAMILGALLQHLTDAGVVLVATSNIHPDGLYANGLQRERFLPAVALLHACTDIVELDGGTDYRLRTLQQAYLYYSPLGAAADAELMKSFSNLVPEHAEISVDAGIEVLGRSILSRRVADDVVWFDFDELCGGPRSAYDYIELARLYHAVLLSNVPQMGAGSDEAMRRFVSLVDEFYDRHVKLIISAQVPLNILYTGAELAFVFERTHSRLLEMQSVAYLAREHRP